tara:strand:- start:1235 stop:1840 length:606 start_codon:yes stop_codon:yes gene_type:complete
MSNYLTQNDILLENLMVFYKVDNNLEKMLIIINGKSNISLRIVDWFVTNYSKNNFTVIEQINGTRLKVYNDYKLKLKAYSKRRFDPFCRWDRITVPLDSTRSIETTIGQLNFFKWALENNIIKYINENYYLIDNDMNIRNSYAKKKQTSSESSVSSVSSVSSDTSIIPTNNKKTRKKREELSQNACRNIKREDVSTVLAFD